MIQAVLSEISAPTHTFQGYARLAMISTVDNHFYEWQRLHLAQTEQWSHKRKCGELWGTEEDIDQGSGFVTEVMQPERWTNKTIEDWRKTLLLKKKSFLIREWTWSVHLRFSWGHFPDVNVLRHVDHAAKLSELVVENGRHFGFLSGCAAQDVQATLIVCECNLYEQTTYHGTHMLRLVKPYPGVHIWIQKAPLLWQRP